MTARARKAERPAGPIPGFNIVNFPTGKALLLLQTRNQEIRRRWLELDIGLTRLWQLAYDATDGKSDVLPRFKLVSSLLNLLWQHLARAGFIKPDRT